jgi:hypothetical protein
LKSRDYYNAWDAAKRLGIPSFALAKLTGTIFVELERKASKKNGRRQRRKNQNAVAAKGSAAPEHNTSTLSDDDSSSSSSEEFNMNRKPKTENIGLSLKFNKRNLEVRGYTRKSDNTWLYSMKSINLVRGMQHAIFPCLFQ